MGIKRTAEFRTEGVRIHERLCNEHEFTGCRTIVSNYVRDQRLRTKKVFVPLAHDPGHAQVDFGEALAARGCAPRALPGCKHIICFLIYSADPHAVMTRVRYMCRFSTLWRPMSWRMWLVASNRLSTWVPLAMMPSNIWCCAGSRSVRRSSAQTITRFAQGYSGYDQPRQLYEFDGGLIISEVPQILLHHHLKQLRLPTVKSEYENRHSSVRRKTKTMFSISPGWQNWK